jgi:hypothetical protein
MKKQHREIIRKLKAAGGRVGINENTPDYITEGFIRGILECPDCRQALEEVDRREAATGRESLGPRIGH